MRLRLKNPLSTNLTLKIVSLLLGYQAWVIIGSSHITTMHYQVPLYFYNESHITKISAPEYVDVCLRGTRQSLQTLTNEPLAAHINVKNLHDGHNCIALSETSLFLPRHIELVSSKPCPLPISVEFIA